MPRVHFKFGSYEDSFEITGGWKTSLDDAAWNFIQNSDDAVKDRHRMLLFIHDYDRRNSSHTLKRIADESIVPEGSIVEIVLSPTNLTLNPFDHDFQDHNYYSPTFCQYCNELLMGLTKQGLKCRICDRNYHKRCIFKLNGGCHPPKSPLTLTNSNSGKLHSFQLRTYFKPTKCHYCNKVLYGLFEQGFQCIHCQYNSHEKCLKYQTHCLGNHLEQMTHDLVEQKLVPKSPFKASIRASRLCKSSPTKEVIIENWMEYFTNIEPTSKRKSFWRLYTDRIHMYNSDNITIKTIPTNTIYINDIVEIKTNVDKNTNSLFRFTVKTKSRLDYFVMDSSLKEIEAKIGMALVSNWETSLKNKISELAKNAIPEYDDFIKNHYDIFSDIILGSGQFGTVYEGRLIANQNHVVAIKIIDKLKFSKHPMLQNEIQFLKSLEHPGIVQLEKTFQDPEKIYLVMEKLSGGDMLDLTLSQPEGKLSERESKFYVSQICNALDYLHRNDVAHCDLKPENILIQKMENTFHKIKICDFGYARIIGESGFRNSVVGTPMYLAPEVSNNEPYNRSLDLWSTGVIIYVILSGMFPFNGAESIPLKLARYDYMYPPENWKHISTLAVDLISKLLVIDSKDRLTANQCLNHPWLDNVETKNDLRKLEVSSGLSRWLTRDENISDQEKIIKNNHLIL